MNTLEIDKYLNNFSNYSGTYPRDLLPNLIYNTEGIVINTDTSTNPGVHWVAVYLNTNGIALYFDSFGLPPMYKDIVNFLDRISPMGWHYNSITFQSIYSDTCGMYCVFFLANMFKTGNFQNFQSIFNHMPNINDRLTKILYKTEQIM